VAEKQHDRKPQEQQNQAPNDDPRNPMPAAKRRTSCDLMVGADGMFDYVNCQAEFPFSPPELHGVPVRDCSVGVADTTATSAAAAAFAPVVFDQGRPRRWHGAGVAAGSRILADWSEPSSIM